MSNKKMLLWAAAVTASVSIFGLLFTIIIGSDQLNSEQQLETALSIMEEGRWDVSRGIARDLTHQIDQEANAGWHYVMGVSSLKSIEDELASPTGRQGLAEATQHLVKAQEIGFPLGLTGQGNFYLGWCFFQTYRWQDAIDQLQPVPTQLPARRSDALRMIVDAQLSLNPPDFVEAEASLETWKSIPGLSASEHAKIKLAQAQLSFLRGDTDQCEALLVEIGPELPVYFDAILRRGSWRLAAAREQEGPQRAQLLAEVEQILRQAKIMAKTPGDLRRQATLLSAQALVEQNRTIEALGTFSAIRQADPDTAEATIAGIEESKILLRQADYEGALATARAVIRNLDDLSLYDERWLSIDDLKGELFGIGEALRDLSEFPYAVRMAKSLARVFPPSDALRLESDVYETWANELERTIAQDPAHEREIRERVKQTYVAAAEGFEQLSKYQLRSPEYTDILWRSIENFRKANQLDQANVLLENYIRYEDRTKLPRGLLAIGKNRMGTGHWQEALVPLQKCLLEFPDHPVSFEARLLAAQAKSELNALDEAVELLEANTKLYQLRPENPIWRDSLFELGQLVFRQGDQLILDLQLKPIADWNRRKAKLEKSQALFLSSIERLGEAFSRWPDEPRHHDARYYHARALRLAAELPTQSIAANPNLIDSARRKLLHQRRELLEQALEQFRALHQSINRTQQEIQAQDKYVALIRNSYFGEADTLFDLERWEEAIQAYRNVTARFINQPESLEALLQMAHCYRKLGKELEATQVLTTAQQVLVRIPPESDARFVAVTRGSRADWVRMIDLMRR